jgi:hypothetical protein
MVASDADPGMVPTERIFSPSVSMQLSAIPHSSDNKSPGATDQEWQQTIGNSYLPFYFATMGKSRKYGHPLLYASRTVTP